MIRIWLERLYALLLCWWLGAQIAVGAVVAPALFEALPDRSQAGTVAGLIFARMGALGMATLLLLLVLRFGLDRTTPDTLSGRPAVPPTWVRWVLAISLALTATAHLYIRPWIADVRAEIQHAGGFAVADPALVRRFGELHGASSLLFLVAAILALILVLRLRDQALAD